MKIIVAAGGTGGHILPALAITEELQKLGCEILYIGNKNSMEERLTKSLNISFAQIDVQKLYRSFTFAHIKFPYKLLSSVIGSIHLFRKFKPDAFVGTGGFVSGPVGLVAIFTGTPIFWQEQNSLPGITTRFISRFAKRIFIAYNGALNYLPKEKCLLVGNPIHPSILIEKDKLDARKYSLAEGNKTLLILGGSQGSTAINNIIMQIINQLSLNKINLLWQCGKRDYDSLHSKISNLPGIYLFPFSHEMGKIYNSADMAIARAGALTLAELEMKKVPAILIPLPTSAGNHQVFNALEQEEKGIAKVIEQKNLNPDILLLSIKEMLDNINHFKSNSNNRQEMKSASVIAHKIIEDLSFHKPI